MKNFKNIAFALIALVVSVTAINAKSLNPANAFSGEEPFTVKYVGNEGNYLIFKVIVNSDNTSNTSFGISNKSEGEIYSENIKSPSKTQILKIEKRHDQDLDFKLKIGQEVYSRSFAILSTISLDAK